MSNLDSKRRKISRDDTATLSVNESCAIWMIIESEEHSPPNAETATQESLDQWGSQLWDHVKNVTKGWPDMEDEDRIMDVEKTMQEYVDSIVEKCCGQPVWLT